MKIHSLYISVLLLLLAACGSSKRTVSSTTQSVKDSVVQKAAQHTASNEKETRHTVEKDTAIGIAGKHVEGKVTLDDLKPARTADGKAVGQTHESKKDGVRSYVSVDTLGNITHGCDVDSYTLVITGLIRDSIYQAHRFDSLAYEYSHRSHIEYSSFEKFIMKVRGSWWLPYVLILLVAAAFVFGVIWFLNKYC